MSPDKEVKKGAGQLSKGLEPLDLKSWVGGVKVVKKGCPPDLFIPTNEKVIATMLKPLKSLIKKACYVA